MKVVAGAFRNPSFSRRSLLKGTLAAFAYSILGEHAFGATLPKYNVVLGRPTKSSIALSLIAGTSLTTYVEYGTSPKSLNKKTAPILIPALVPKVVELSGLQPNSNIYYRVRSKSSGAVNYDLGAIGNFSTQKKPGANFSFVVQGDSHPERAGKMFNADLYVQTLNNISQQKPDFMVMLGDDFSIDPLIGKGAANQVNVENIYSTQRNWLSAVGKTIPLFLVNGNHEQAAAYLLDGTSSNPAVLAGNARMKYFPLPDSNDFYSADTESIEFVGKPRDYYAWTWGDALFITLDPYWHSKNPVDNVAGVSADPNQGGKGSGKTTDLWSVGIGDIQYAWLKQTLESSKAKYKFVFAHHVMGTGRGAVEVSTGYEWGGADPKGKKTFAEMRPNWEMPIHDLMVKSGVTIFFQGHDHIFVHQERDGLIYQSMPNPADDTFTMFNDTAYLSGTKAPNSGHVRVTVGPTQGKVEYFLSARPQDESADRKNLQIAHSYDIKAKI
jgi:hypothetical protein